MKQKLTLLILALFTAVGAWATPTVVTVIDKSVDATTYGSLSGTTFTTNAVSGMAGVTIDGIIGTTATGFSYGACLALTSTASGTITMTAPEGYVIIGYTLTARSNTYSVPYTLTPSAGGDAVTTSTSGVTLTTLGLESQTATFTYSAASANSFYIPSMVITIGTAEEAVFVKSQIAAYNTVQGWISTVQSAMGLVKDAANYVSNAKSSAEGTYAALLDGDYSTYFHGAYGSEGPDEDQYLQATLPSAVDAIYFYYKKRSQNNNNRPTSITIYGSNDNSTYTEITTISSGLPTDASVIDYASSKISLGASYQYLRFTVTATNNDAKNNSGHVFFTFSEFYILPSDTEVDNVMNLRATLAGRAALNYTAENIADVTAANTALLSTVVNVTYALYESDGETFVSNTVVEQEKNSAVSIPSSITSYTYYDYETSGSIGTTDCTIKVTRTLKSGYAISLGDLNSAKCYNIRNNRGTWAVGSGAEVVNSTVELSLAFLSSDTKQQFAFIYYDETDDDTDNGKYYLYSVGESKFAYVNGNKLSLAENFTAEVAASPVTFQTSTASSANNEPIIVTVGGNMFGVSTGMSPDIYKYNVASDGGNSALITEAGSFSATAATALVEFYFTHTLTYVVEDESANTLFTSDPINIYKGTFNTLPTDYHRDYFFTYATDGVTINDESGANTNLVFTASPKSGILQYTADTTSPIYYNLNIRSKYLAYNDEATGDVELLTSSTPFNPDAAWAFIGDPYTGFKIINQTNGKDKYLTYTSVVTGGNSGNNNIQFVDDGDFDSRYWYVDANTGGFCLRMKENTNIYFHHQNSSPGFLRTCSVTEWSAVHNDAGSTLTFASDEDVLVDLYSLLNSYTYGTEIGNFTPTSPWTVSDIESKLSNVKDDIDNSTTSDYADDYKDLLDITEKITVVTPPDGYYRLKNAATSKYIRATNIGSSGGVVANLADPASDVSSVIQVTTIDGHTYLRSNTGWFNWVASSYDNKGYLAAAKDKYVHWLGTPYDNGLAFSIAYGNGEGDYASYLNQGYYTSQGDEDGTIKGSNGSTAAASWIFEPATDVTIAMNSDGAGTYYATLYLPFDATISDATAYTLEKSGEWLVPTAVTDNKVPAGTPVLLKGTNASATATINTGDAFNSGSPLDCALTGTYMAATIDGENDYVLGIKSGVVGFYHWNSNNLGANRAYLDTPAAVKGFVLMFDDDATGINTVNGEGVVVNGPIYNLAGQRLNKMQKGINIVNGKKVLY